MHAQPNASPHADTATELEARLRGFFESENAVGAAGGVGAKEVGAADLEPFLRRLRPLQLAALAPR